MQIQIKAPESIRGKVLLPASKSISNRALVLNTLAGNKDLPVNVSDCDDTKVMLQWLAQRPEVVNIGAAGTAMRFSAALLAVSEGTHTITGTERMQNRPIAVLVDALRTLGATIEYVGREGFPPLRITGNKRLAGGGVTLRGDVSSQYISALLMIAPTLQKGLQLNLTDEIVSRPYINMTLAMMREFGAVADWESDSVIEVQPGAYQSNRYVVENDWSAASYWYEMLALSSHAEDQVLLPGLFAQSLQGDSCGAKVFEKLGVQTSYYEDGVKLTKSPAVVSRLDYDFVEMPDLAQTFVVTCCMMGVPFHFTGLQSLKIKETDRINALKVELAKLGFLLEDRNDSELLWAGQRTAIQPEASIDTYEDHRMAMAFAPAALRLGSIRINHPEVVSKSYPRYWDDLQSVGFTLEKTVL